MIFFSDQIKNFKRQIEDVNGDVEMEPPPSLSEPPVAKKSYSQMAQSYGKAVIIKLSSNYAF